MRIREISKHIFLIILVISGCSFVSASSVVVPNEFTSGTPAKAAEVNENFTELESAVNDNDSRVSLNEISLLQHSNSLNENSNIIQDNTDAISEINEVKNYVYPINVASIHFNAGDVLINQYGFSSLSNTFDRGLAPVVLPNGANIIDMNCFVFDNHPTADFTNGHIRLLRNNIEEGVGGFKGSEEIVSIDLTTSGQVNTVIKLLDSDNIIQNTFIDNMKYMYYVDFAVAKNEGHAGLVVSGCRINYEVIN